MTDETSRLLGGGDGGEGDPAPSPSPARCLPTRHVFALMGFLGFANVYAMRVNLSVAIVAMVNSSVIPAPRDNSSCPGDPGNSTAGGSGEFNWGEREQGWLLGAFFYGYVLTQIPGGRLAEKYGGARLYGVGVLITAVFTLLTPLAARTSLYCLVAVRVVEGLGEGVTFPAMHAMLAVWVPAGERSRLAGLVYSGAQAGTVLSLPLSGWLCEAAGWQTVFYVFGCLGCVWWAAWLVLVSDSPSCHPTITPEEREYILARTGVAARPPPVPWPALLTSGPVWALVIAHVSQNFGFYTLLTELPTYLASVLHFNIRSNSLVSALPYLLMLLTGLAATRAADLLLERGWDRTTVRKMFNSLAIYLPALFLVLAGYSGCDYTLTIALLCLAVGTNGAHYAGFMCVHIDIASNYAGTLLGLTNCAANIMGFVAPAVTGYIVEGHSDVPHWRMVFFIASLIYCLGNTVFLVFGTAKEQKWNRQAEEVAEPEVGGLYKVHTC